MKMCCGEKENKSRNGSNTFARNVKKPSMFLSSLIVKRRDNRRACKPNMLLDAVLSNAIRNIKKDKTISTLTNLPCTDTEKISKHDYHKKNNTYYSRSQGGTTVTDDDMKLNMNMKGGSRTIPTPPQVNDNENRDFINDYLSDVDHFFEKLKNVKVLQHKEVISISNDNDNDSRSNTLKTRICSEEPSADDLVDNFIETGIVL